MKQIVEDYTEENTINIRDKIRQKLKNVIKSTTETFKM